MSTMRALIITTLAALAASVCAAETFDLAVGESKTLADSQLTIGFTGVTEDSRCPLGVTCIWEGDAAVALWVQIEEGALKEEAATEDFTLHTAFDNSTERYLYTIKLDAVSPYPEFEIPIDPNQYIVRITATPNVASPVVPTTWGAIKTLYR